MPVRDHLFRIYGWLRDRIAPGLRYSQYFYERRLETLLRADVDWLDLGCGHHILPLWRGEAERALVERCRTVTGIDYDLTSLTRHRSVRRLVRGDISWLPYRDESFDVVTANMVVEHLRDPEEQFREIARVLRPGGLVLLHTPNLLGYSTVLNRLFPAWLKRTVIRTLDGRSPDDVFPTFYRANTARRLATVAESAGLPVDSVQMVGSDPMFAVIPPLAAIELVALRVLLTRPFRRFRIGIIAVLRKPANGAPVARMPAFAARVVA
jgi:ubiquinone/menaquinone biosynthesis C-methylase UbiE